MQIRIFVMSLPCYVTAVEYHCHLSFPFSLVDISAGTLTPQSKLQRKNLNDGLYLTAKMFILPQETDAQLRVSKSSHC